MRPITSSNDGTQVSNLLSLPLDVLHRITTTSGPASRQLCKALAAAFGPLLAFQPDGLLTPAHLHAALAALAHRHAPTLQTLNLSHVGRVLTHPQLAHLLPAFPALRHLTLHNCPHLSPGSLATIASVTTLTSLDLRACRGLGASTWSTLTHLSSLRSLTLELDSFPTAPTPAPCPAALPAPPLPSICTPMDPNLAPKATCSLPAATSASSTSASSTSTSCTGTSCNNCNGIRSTSSAGTSSQAGSTPTLAAHTPPTLSPASAPTRTPTPTPTPAPPPSPHDAPFAPMAALTRLTHLHLAAAKELPDPAVLSLLSATARLPHLHALHLGGHLTVPGGATSAALLTTHPCLRSLQLTVFDLDEDGPRKAGALLAALHSPALAHLTALHLRLEHDYISTSAMGTLGTDVAACLAHLPHLQSLGLLVRWAQLPLAAVLCSTALTSLQLAFWGEGYTPLQLGHLRAHLGARLQALHLEQGVFCPASLQQITGLTALTRLSLQSAARLPVEAIVGVAPPRLAALGRLRALHLQGGVARWALDTPQLAELTGLTAVSLLLCAVKDPELEQVRALTALRALDLGDTWGLQGGGLQYLRTLPALRDLGLPLPGDLQQGPDFLRGLVPPPGTLRRVRVGRAGGSMVATAEQLAACAAVLEAYCEVVLPLRVEPM